MERYVLRFQGQGDKPRHDVERVKSLSGTKVLEDSSSRMLLVESSKTGARKLEKLLPDWSVSPERMISLPDSQPKLRRSR